MRCPHCMHVVGEDTRTCPHCAGRVRGQRAALVTALVLLGACSLGAPLIGRAFLTGEGSPGWFYAAIGVIVVGIAAMVLLAQNTARDLPLPRISRAVTISMLLLLLYILVMPGVVWQAPREEARLVACTSNQRQIITAVQMYMQDHDGMLPQDWTGLREDIEGTEALRCPAAARDEHTDIYTYGLNRHVLGKPLKMFEQDAETLLVVADSNRTDGLLTPPHDIAARHTNHRYVAAFLDGHVETRSPADDAQIRWK